MFRVFRTAEFNEDYADLDHAEQIKLNKILIKLEEQGDVVGRPLKGDFLREKRLNGKRTYYLVYTEFSSLLMLGVSNKKLQQVTIDTILLNFEPYKQFVIEKLQKNN
ncbi:MAG: hypothetical protein Q8L34_04330 [Candidatus Woesearchaeota archaeon]|nr:hypothetical protein [Candidatus Woesearchaeota archaeon]